MSETVSAKARRNNSGTSPINGHFIFRSGIFSFLSRRLSLVFAQSSGMHVYGFLMFSRYFEKRLSVLFLLTGLLFLSPLAEAKENVPWLIYFYLVGSDLESGDGSKDSGGSATSDLQEIAESMAGKNVRFLVQTGGAKEWKNDVVSSRKIQIYEVRDNDIELLKSWNNQSMGREDTLSRFLEFGESRYNPRRRMIIFWNHGAGPTGGVGYDENFSDDFLEMSEINGAFQNVYGRAEKPFDIIGFDACLMGSLASGYHMNRWGHVMIASEETEPSLGWFYTPWLNALEKNPRMSLRKLSESIVDTYHEDLKKYSADSNSTLSAVSLDHFPELMLAYDELGITILDAFDDQGALLSKVARAANKSESYGIQNRKPYSDVIDLRQYANNLKSLAPKEAKAVLSALDKYVIYSKNGRYKKGSGVSVYYPLDNWKDPFRYVLKQGAPTSLNLAYGLQVGAVNRNDAERIGDQIDFSHRFLKEMLNISRKYDGYADSGAGSGGTVTPPVTPPETPEPGPSSGGHFSSGFAAGLSSGTGGIVAFAQQAQTLQKKGIDSLEDVKVAFDSDSNAYVKVPEDILPLISSVKLEVLFYEPPSKDTPEGILVNVGSDVRLEADWDKGVFTDGLDGTWAALDGHLLPLTVVNVTDDYVNYDCSIKINGHPYNMMVSYDFKTEKYSITGVQRESSNGVPGRFSNILKPGDKITTVFGASSLTGDDEEQEVDIDTFVYRKDSVITDEKIGEINMLFGFTFEDSFGNTATSELVAVEINNKDELIMQPFSEAVEEIARAAEDSADDEDDSEGAGEDDIDDDNAAYQAVSAGSHFSSGRKKTDGK